MLPRYHFLISSIILGIVYILNLITLSEFLIILISSVLIDIDHYFYYVLEKKDYSLNNAINWYLHQKRKLQNKDDFAHRNFVFIFHGIEPILILYFLSNYFPILFFISIGFLIHLIIDLTVAHKERVFNMKLFLTYSIYRHYKLKKLGIPSPWELF